MTTEYKTVAELLEDPKRWTTEYPARDLAGNNTSPTGPMACSFCIVGAVFRVYDHEPLQKLREVQKLEPRVGIFNDTHTHAEVLELVRKAGI